jgi:hypothetical protein
MAGVDDLAASLESLIAGVGGMEITIGIQATEGAEVLDGGATVLDIANWNHWGTRRIPARPWLTQTKAQHEAGWTEAIVDGIDQLAQTGDADAFALRLRQVAVVAVADAKQVLTDLADPPNAPSTIAAKGSSNPLIDTGHLRNSHRATVTVNGKTEVVA